MSFFYRAISYAGHVLKAKHSRGFGVHSPFVYDFIRNVTGERHPSYIFDEIEKIRQDNLSDNTSINFPDWGTGQSGKRTVSEIARKSLKRPLEGQLLFRTIRRYNCKHVTELGTSLGITTLYLAASSKEICCTSFEGCDDVAAIARKNAEKLKQQNINIFTGNIDETLEPTLKLLPPQDLFFLDANHTYEATIQYFETILNFCHNKSIIVVDDIYWSEGMTQAWKEIMKHPRIRVSVDLYHLGFLFLNTELHPKHYRIIL